MNARSDCGNRFRLSLFFSFFSISPGPWRGVYVRQDVLCGDFEGRKKRDTKAKEVLRLLTHGIYFMVHFGELIELYETRLTHFWKGNHF